ncbi:MAG: cation-translocating P-type ATPase [Pedosphaera sp.]|nr:cation-translocating P-type ATPase [Pedosphaera sp.]
MADTGIEFRKPRTPPPSAGAITLLTVEGMDCGNCAHSVTTALRSVSQVFIATVDLQTRTARVVWSSPIPGKTESLLQAVRIAGYEASPVSPNQKASPSVGFHSWQRSLQIGFPAMVLLLTAEWVFGLGMNEVFRWIAFLIASLIQVSLGKRFFIGAWRQLRVGKSTMDTLVSLGSGSAWLFSTWALINAPHLHLFFTESVTILTLISLGHWLEARMSERAGDALKTLLSLSPSSARKLHADDSEQEVAVHSLALDDRIALRPGDRVPVDAIITEGRSAVDESMLTGEPLPISKSTGANLFAGTINRDGYLVARVTAVGEATALAHIAATVRRAQSSRASIQRLADRVSSVFVPVVVVIALLTATYWLIRFDTATHVQTILAGWLWQAHAMASPAVAALTATCAVLIVACPCAMGLATPVALMAGINAAARRGILIRDAIALEKSGSISAVAFDKTGTLTLGEPTLSLCLRLSEFTHSDDTLLALAATLAAPSNHPLSRAILRAATAANINAASASQWREFPGLGIQAFIDSGSFRQQMSLGSVQWMESLGLDVNGARAQTEAAATQGEAVVLLANTTEVIGFLTIGDSIRPEAITIIQRLITSGRSVHLLSGDSAAACLWVAKAVGIPEDKVHAICSPEDKLTFLKKIQAQGRRVAFVGEGINDAPSLAAADLGIAVGRATDMAREAADIVLLRPGLLPVIEALDLANQTLRIVRQNLFWAFFYNAAAIPLAALGLINPMLCALTMGLSDLIVIANAQRLRSPKRVD